MTNLWKYLRSRYSMTFEKTLFIDRFNGRWVFLWTDCYGLKWMAQTKWGFRCPHGLNSKYKPQ